MKLARLFMLYLVLFLIIKFQNTGNFSANKASLLSIGSGSDIKLYPKRNEALHRLPYEAMCKQPLERKVCKMLNLTKMILWTGSLVLLAGDICPQPGPVTTNVNLGNDFDVKTRGLKIAHLNIRSLPSKLDELTVRMTNGKSFDILTLSETWLSSEMTDDEINIPGYSCVRKDRSKGLGGGVAIYCREDLNYSPRDDLKGNNEAIWIELHRTKCKPMVIGCIYRPPSQSIDEFLTDLDHSLQKLDNRHTKVLLGDFNVDVLEKTRMGSSLKRKLRQTTENYDLEQLITSPTRITESTSTLIDLIFTNEKHRIVDSGVLHFGLSDHSLVYCVFKSGVPHALPRILEYRSYKNYNKDAFIKDLNQVPWEALLENIESIDDAVFTWNNLFSDIANEHAPLKHRRVKGVKVPWMNPTITTYINDRDFHRKKANNSKTGYHWDMYRKFRNLVNREIKAAKSKYYINLIHEANGDSSKLWKAIKETLPTKLKTNITSLVVDGITYTTPKCITRLLNLHFVNIGMKLAMKFGSFLYCPSRINSCDAVFGFQPVTCDYVLAQLRSLKPNKAIGLDKISSRMLKDSAEVIASILTSIFNKSIETKTFPSVWKDAKVSAIFKCGDRKIPSNYRPISVLPVVSKLLERAVHQQLLTYLTENNLLSPQQFGFRCGSSTLTAVAQFSDEILSNMDNGKITGVIFLDLAKAFDTINHRVLQEKLFSYGIRDRDLEWFQSYLSNRSQVVYYDNTYSDKQPVQIGVAQGSILGPLLFTIFMNDLPSILTNSKITLFADDAAMYYAHSYVNDLQSKLNADLNNVTSWLKENQLTLNVSKSKFMLIGSGKRLNKIDSIDIDFKVEGESLNEVEVFNYLGIRINSHLTWKDHIDQVRSKINKKLALLRRIKHLLPLYARIMFYNSLVLPVLDYGDIIWGDRHNSSIMADLQVLQNKAARIILDLPPYHSGTDALRQLSWKPLESRRSQHRAIFMYKCVNDLFLHSFNYKENKEFHSHDTRHKNNIRKSRSKTNWGLMSSINKSADDWNNLSETIRKAPNLDVFKRHLLK